jgi:DNA-binding NtrC family response regulator
MSDHLFVLLIHDRPGRFDSLRQVLRDLSLETYSVKSCKEASDLIAQCRPHIVFTQASLADGSWLTVQRIAEETKVPLSVIVVADVPDTRKYVSIMERGAFDFVAPPFEHEPMRFVVRSAALDAQRRRDAAAAHAVYQPAYSRNALQAPRVWPAGRSLSSAWVS